MMTKLAESDASNQTIMAIAGHMSQDMLAHYSHIRSAAKRRAVEALPQLCSRRRPPRHQSHHENNPINRRKPASSVNVYTTVCIDAFASRQQSQVVGLAGRAAGI
jgi:hypothetical protein